MYIYLSKEGNFPRYLEAIRTVQIPSVPFLASLKYMIPIDETMMLMDPTVESIFFWILNEINNAGYKTPWICKKVIEDGRIPVLPYKRPMGAKDFFRPYEYVYDEYYNCVICPENQILNFLTINRDGYSEFKSDPKICKNCPSRSVCTRNVKFEKTATKHIWNEYLEIAEDIRHTPKYKKLYEIRKETIERVFANAKEKYGMRCTLFRGLSHVTN